MRKQILKIQKFWLPKWCYRNIKALMHQITKIPPHISRSIAVIVVAVVMAVTLPPHIKVEAQQSGSGGPSASTETNAQNNTANSGVDVSPATPASIVTPEPTTTITPTVTPEPTATITPAITPEPTATLTPAITPGPNAGSITAEETLPSVNTANAAESAAQIQEALRNANIDTFLNAAENQLGKPYIHGNEGPRSFDCSGLVYYCLKQAGVSKARNTAAGYSQETDWEKIASMHDLQKGDLMFFRANGKKVGHVGIYIGNGEMIDASSSNRKVVKRSCLTSFWVKNFITARRPAFN